MSRIELINDYIAECSPLLDVIVESIFAIKIEPDSSQLLDKIFRAFHTIKSNSSIIDQPELGDLCHVCEDALALVRDKNREVDDIFISCIMLSIDHLNDSFIRLDADVELVALDSKILFKLAKFIEG
jgi:two-component system chemotaxis sensor kinase CheA